MVAIFYIPMLIGVILYEIFRKKVYFIDTLSIFNFFFCLFYLLTGIAISLFPDTYLADFPFARPFIDGNVLLPIVIFTAYILFVFFHNLVATPKKFPSVTIPSKIVVSTQYEKNIVICLVIMLTFAFILLAIVIYSRGGLKNTIEMAGAIRGGYYEHADKGGFSYFNNIHPQIFRFCCFLSTFLLCLYSNNKVLKTVLFIITLIGATLSGMVLGGRSNTLYPVSFCILAFLFYKQKVKIIPAIVAFFIVISVLYYGKSFYAALSWRGGLEAFNLTEFTQRVNEQRGSKIHTLIGEFSPGYICTGPAISNMSAPEYDCFKSLLYAPTYAIPSSIININRPQPITYLSTYKAMGETDYSITYPGIIGYGFLCLSWFGFFLVMAGWGSICGLLDKKMYESSPLCAMRDSVYLAFVSMLYYIFFGNPGGFVKQMFTLFVICLFFLVLKKRLFLKDNQIISLSQ